MRISDWSSDVCSSDLFTTEQGLGVGAVKRGPTFARCIVVDDDPDILLSARLLLRDLFEEVAAFQSPDEALAAMHEGLPDVILLDANFGRGATNAAEGFHWLGEILKRDPEAVVVMITAHGGVQIAVEAMKRGAPDFVSKHWSDERQTGRSEWRGRVWQTVGI